jgi:hypothetical protein
MDSLTDYERRLKDHDWYYMMSDDPSVYERGLTNHRRLLAEANTSPEHQALYQRYLGAPK